jgi:hypothetical protein
VKQRFISLAALLGAVIGLSLTVSSCREDAIIKSSLTPAVDNIHTFGLGTDYGTDTMRELTMLTGTVFQDSVVTSTRNTGFPIFHALGFMEDPFAGKTNASIYAQFVPTAVKTELNGTLDSLVLVLPYAGFTWGDTVSTTSQTIKVFAINGSFSKDTTYYSYSQVGTEATPIGTATIITGPSNTGIGAIQDSLTVGIKNPKKKVAHLRITLNKNWAQNTFIPKLKADSTYPDFTTAFPGLYLANTDTNGSMPKALPYFRLNGGSDIYSSAAILAYMDGNDSIPVLFPYLETYGAHFNRIRRNRAGYGAETLLDTTKPQSYVAMQNAPGLTIDLKLPYIQNLPKNVIINKAEITFVVATAPGQTPEADARFFLPLRLYPQGINSSGGQYTIADRYPINDGTLNFIDGTASTATRNGKTVTVYRLNIPREVQQAIVAGSSGLHLRIGGTVNFPAAYRFVAGSRDNPDPTYRPSINIIYSKQ